MLKVVNLQKIYNAGTQTEVRALDGVTLEFPEKGMVFLLGRSGSGKSTLLNVAGGLDAPSDGEIIVKGKSSKDFSQSDFDSYRNTFVGFIFQEYNILNEFSVEDNIALALELQGKPKDKEAVAALLEQVDLSGYAKRKPNTLSGGQKQRIAIARALIKSPEIIMADEPTGALDSNTGKQVFDTLKKLSQDKLVIVVSHDREFAEQYGDRIIELKDGKILSDVSKTTVAGDAVSKNVSSLGDVLCIKKGSDLTENDFEEIKKFLKETDGDVVIANGEKSVGDFKKVSRIRDTGEKEVFAETDESKQPKRQYGKDDANFIRSRLPLRHAVRIGGAGLKTKPFRLTFTILLCTVAFVLFGVLSTMTFYDSTSTLRQTLMDSPINMIRVEKQYKTVERSYNNGELDYEYESHSVGRFHPDDVEAFKAQYGDGAFGAISAYQQISAQTPSQYYQTNLVYMAAIEEGHPLVDTAVAGSTLPKAKEDIWLSGYLADVLINATTAYDAEGELLNVNSRAELIGKKLSIGGVHYTVTGVFDSGVIDAKYDVLKEGTADNNRLEYEFSSYLADGLHQLIFLSKEGVEAYSSRYGNMDTYAIFGDKNLIYASVYSPEDGGFIYDTDASWSNAKYCSYDALTSYVNTYFFDAGKTAPGANEAVVPSGVFYGRLSNVISSKKDNLESVSFEEWRFRDNIANYYNSTNQFEKNADDDISAWNADFENGTAANRPTDPTLLSFYENYMQQKKAYEEYRQADNYYSTLIEYAQKLSSGGTEVYNDEKEAYDIVPLTDQERADYHAAVMEEIGSDENLLNVSFRLYSYDLNGGFGETLSKRVVGVYMPKNTSNGFETAFLLTQDEEKALLAEHRKNMSYYHENETNYVEKSGSVFTTVFLPFDGSAAKTDAIVAMYEARETFDETNWTRIMPRSSITDGFQNVDEFISELSKVFLWVGLVLAVFAALLFSNFISVSISHKKREIGILRAVGARSTDVFKIFFSESFIIASICVVLSIAGSIILCHVLNNEVASMIGASLFVFGFLSFAVLIGVALLTAVAATFLPVYNAARKKPVDSIRAL